MNKRSTRSGKRRGFTLVEVLLVLVILVIIGSIATVSLFQMERSARMRAAEAQIKAFKVPLQAYRLDTGDFPSGTDGLQALRTQPSGLANPTKWLGPYLETEVPLDPWDNPYQYEYPGKRQTDLPDIWSYGPDKIDGTEDDIGNWVTIRE